MFKARIPISYKIFYYLVFAVVFLRQLRSLMYPWLGEGHVFTFRSDNFFSFSGGQIRRGLIGEILIVLQSWDWPAIFIYSLILLLVYAWLYLWVFPKLLESFNRWEFVLIILSGFFLLPGIDREIFMLLPAAYYFLRSKQDLGFFILLALVAFLHELALLLYFPFILKTLQQSLREPRWDGVIGLVLVLVSYGSVILIAGDLNLAPERDFWPQHGVSGLENKYLYKFSGMGLLEVIKLHGARLLSYPQTKYALIGLISFAVLLILSFKRFRAKPIVIYYYLAVNALLFILTIDYGRYFYLLFFFYLLVLSSGLLKNAESALSKFDFLLPAVFERWMNFEYQAKYYHITLLVFALAPFGFYVGDTQLSPALWQELEQLIDFKLSKHAAV